MMMLSISGFEVLADEDYVRLAKWRSTPSGIDFETPLFALLYERKTLQSEVLLYVLRDEVDLMLAIMAHGYSREPEHESLVDLRRRLDKEFAKRKMDPDGLVNTEALAVVDAALMTGYISGSSYPTTEECRWGLRFANRTISRVKDEQQRRVLSDNTEVLGRYMLALDYERKRRAK